MGTPNPVLAVTGADVGALAGIASVVGGVLLDPDPEDAPDDYVRGLVSFLCDFFGYGSDTHEDVRSVLEAQARTSW